MIISKVIEDITKDDIKVTINEGRIQCDNFPFVILTSNGERDFPPAFLRRCLRLDIPEPDKEKLTRIVQAHFSDKKNEAEFLDEWDEKTKQDINIKSFAKIATDTLRRLGGEYAEFAKYLEQKSQKNQSSNEIAIEDEETADNPKSPVDIQPFKFEVATIEIKKSPSSPSNTELIIKRRRQQANGFVLG